MLASTGRESVLQNGSKGPSTQEYIKMRLLGLSDSKLHDIFKLSLEAHRQLQKSLLATYSAELSPDFTPSWFEYFKSRQLAKISIAKELRELCQTPAYTIIDVSNFIKAIEKLQKKNLAIDANGGRLGFVLNSADEQMTAISDMIYEYHRGIRQISEPINAIFSLLICEISQRRSAVSYHLSDYNNSFSFTYIHKKIEELKGHLIREISRQLEPIITDPGNRQIRAQELVTELYKVITSDLDFIKADDTDEAKIQFLKKNQLTFYLEAAASEFSQSQFATTPSQTHFAYLCRYALYSQFCDSLQYLEKELCFERHVKEQKDMNGYVFVTLHQNKLEWYRATIEELNSTDDIRTESLIKSLKSNLSFSITPDSSTDQVMQTICDDFGSHEKHYLQDDQHQDMLKGHLFEWKRRVRNEIEKFGDTLKALDEALVHGETQNPLITSLIALVQTTYPSIQKPQITHRPRPLTDHCITQVIAESAGIFSHPEGSPRGIQGDTQTADLTFKKRQ